MRVMVLDGSRLLAAVVGRLAPAGVEVEAVTSFEEALDRLRCRPPDALIANIGPADLPWRKLKDCCRDHTPRIPVLFESCVHRDPEEAGIGSLNRSTAFLSKPYPVAELRRHLEWLLGSVAPVGAASDRPGRGVEP